MLTSTCVLCAVDRARRSFRRSLRVGSLRERGLRLTGYLTPPSDATLEGDAEAEGDEDAVLQQRSVTSPRTHHQLEPESIVLIRRLISSPDAERGAVGPRGSAASGGEPAPIPGVSSIPHATATTSSGIGSSSCADCGAETADVIRRHRGRGSSSASVAPVTSPEVRLVLS